MPLGVSPRTSRSRKNAFTEPSSRPGADAFRLGKTSHSWPGAFCYIPYKVLSRVFRGKFLAELRAAYDSGALIHRSLPERWREWSQFDRRCSELSAREWVVYQQSPPPDLEPAASVKYLARYVSGVAISDKRLVSCEHGQVTFTVKNRKKQNRREERTISVTDFLSRFLQHVLPSGFTRVRYYGIYLTCYASLRERCRELLLATAPTAGASGAVPSVTRSEPVSTASSTNLPAATPTPTATASPDSASVRATALLCAVCHQGVMGCDPAVAGD